MVSTDKAGDLRAIPYFASGRSVPGRQIFYVFGPELAEADSTTGIVIEAVVLIETKRYCLVRAKTFKIGICETLMDMKGMRAGEP